MTTQLSDNREFESATVAEADAQFAELAQLEISIAKIRAIAEKKIVDIKTKADLATAADEKKYNKLLKWIDKYIMLHKDRFKKPRMRPTKYGKYGLRKSTKLHIENKDLIIAYSDEQDLDLYTTTNKIGKKAITDAEKDGYDVPGCREISGDIANIDIDKKLLNEAIKKG